MSGKMAIQGITMFRARDGVADLDELLPGRNDPDGPEFADFKLADGSIALAYYTHTDVAPPRWAPFFGGIIDPNNLASASSSAVVAFQRHDLWYLVTFGYARRLINLDLVEPTFGLKVTLNGIDPDKIRSVDHKRVDTVSRLTREQLSRDSRIGTFGLDVHQDLLSAVTGVPGDETLGSRLYGRDAVGLRVDITPPQLGGLADRLEALYQMDTYKERFRWVDNIAEVRGAAEVTALDKALVAALRSEVPHGFELAPPEIVDWEKADRFVYDRHSDEEPTELRLSEYHALVRDRDDISIEVLKADRVRLLDGDGSRLGGWSIYRCLAGEMTTPGGVFVISDGKWYRVDSDFAADVDKAVQDLIGEAVKLPAYGGKHDDEEAYNKDAAKKSGGHLCCMDRKYIWPRSWQDRIEFCDLFRNDLLMIHVKRYSGGSPTLSHLFAQGSVSMRCLLTDRALRVDVNEKLDDGFSVPEAAPDPQNCHVVFAVVAEPGREGYLPFFSRVALRNAAETIQQMGAKVTWQSVPNPS